MQKVSTADYVLAAKKTLGDVHMSDRVLGEHLGYSTSSVSGARYGNMPDPMAIQLEDR